MHLINILNDETLEEIKYHTHKCVCGNIWRHSNFQYGNVKAHTCDKCGKEEWFVYRKE